MGTLCQHCHEEIPDHFELCWNCGASIDGCIPPTASSVSSPASGLPVVEAPEGGTRSGGIVVLLLVLTTLAPLSLTWFAGLSAVFVFGAVVVTNIIGVVVGLMVTHVWGLPDDGSLPKRCREDEQPHA